MLPAVSATPVDTASAAGESGVDSGGCASAFAAAIAQLREVAIPASPPPGTFAGETVEAIEPGTEDAALVTDAMVTTQPDAIDWLLGQCTGTGTDSMPVLPGDFTAVPASVGSTPGPTPTPTPTPTPASTLIQMLAVARGAFSGAPAAKPADILAESVPMDTLLHINDRRSEGREESSLLDSTKPAALALEANASPQPGRTEAPAKVATAALHTPVGSRAWNDELASKLTWLIDRGEQLASIRVSPDSLGPIDIRIAIREGEASIWFGASQADTRHAIEQAIPRLREMLASQGLSLADAGVFQQAPNDPHRALLRNDLRRASQESGEALPVTSSLLARRPGLIDDYA